MDVENLKFSLFVLNLRLKIHNLKEKNKNSEKIINLCDNLLNTLNVFTPVKLLKLEKRIL